MTIEAGGIRNIIRKPVAGGSSSLAGLDDAQLVARVRAVAHLKRFFERYCADTRFRDLLARETEPTLRDYKLDVAPGDVLAFLAANKDGEGANPDCWTENLRAFRDFVLDCMGGLEILETAASSTNRRFHLWRERQLARLRFDFSAMGDSIVRPVVALELSKGCTVGCWFCAISAEKFGGNFVYGDGLEWRDTLTTLRNILGPAAGAGFCYWATDPLDNPEYERFALDFHQVTGSFPPTTTALPLKTPNRTRALLWLAHSHACRLTRFSVLTLAMLDKLHREFSAEELALVELVPQNSDALVFSNFPKTCPAAKVRAGKLLEEEPVTRPGVRTAPGTIACVAGFLINMVERTVRLVSPCLAGEDWPLGYRVHANAAFADHAALGKRLELMIDEHMPDYPPAELPMRFLPGVQFTALVDGFRLASPIHMIEFRDCWGRFGHNYPVLGELVKRGDLTCAELTAELVRAGSTEPQIDEAIGQLWRNGVLAEDLTGRVPLLLVRDVGAGPERAYHD